MTFLEALLDYYDPTNPEPVAPADPELAAASQRTIASVLNSVEIAEAHAADLSYMAGYDRVMAELTAKRAGAHTLH